MQVRGKLHSFNNFLSRLFKSNLFYCAIIFGYVLIFLIQINLPPLERYPGWDSFWEDTRIAGNLTSMKQALGNYELPAINPYLEFGWNFAGDPKDPPSYLSPVNLLIMVLPVAVVMIIRLGFFLILGGIGTFLFLNLITKDRVISFIGGLTYISLPIVIFTEFFYFEPFHVFYLVPLFLYLLHKLFESFTFKKVIIFIILSIFTISSGNIYTLVIFPTVIILYSFLIALFYYGYKFQDCLKKSLLYVFLFILSGSFYIVPLINNLKNISFHLDIIRKANIDVPKVVLNLKSFINFFISYNWGALFKPNQSHGLLLYIPIFFIIAIVTCIIFKRITYRDNPKAIIIPLSLVLMGIIMFLYSLLYYSLPGVADKTSGAAYFRHHINLIPFVSLLAGFICLSQINRLKRSKRFFFLFIIIISLSIDILLFSIKGGKPYDQLAALEKTTNITHHITAPFQSSNLISVHFMNDMWQVLPWGNFLLVILILLCSYKRLLNKLSFNNFFITFIIVFSILLSLFYISLHNDLRIYQQKSWQWLTRSSYRIESYSNRKKCIDGVIDRYDLNYRTLYVGHGDDLTSPSGRNWKILAETELNVTNREKALFSRRQIVHPYTCLLYSTFFGKFSRGNFWPPKSIDVIKHLDFLSLMGIKWVISSDGPITHPNLIFKGRCFAEKGLLKGLEGGFVYIYELSNPIGIAFFESQYKIVNILSSVRTIFVKGEHPWKHDVVYLEEDPSIDINRFKNMVFPENLVSSAKIVNQSFNTIDINVSSPTVKFLVLDYIYRPFWKAKLGTTNLKIYRAYGGLMAVVIPPGKNTIRFSYVPYDLYLGLILTALSFFILIIIKYNLATKASTLFYNVIFKRSKSISIIILSLTVISVCNKHPLASNKLSKANLYFKKGQCLKAIKEYNNLLNNNYEDPIIYEYLGECYIALNKWPDAIKNYQIWTDKFPSSSRPRIKLGWSYFGLKDYEGACIEFDKSIATDLSNPEGYQGKGLSLFKQGRYKDTLEYLKKWVELKPNSFDSLLTLGLANYLAEYDAKLTIEYLKRALLSKHDTNISDLAKIHYALGGAYFKLNLLEKSYENYLKAFKLDPLEQEILKAEDRIRLDETAIRIIKPAWKDVLLDLDFSKVVMDGENAYAIATTGQLVPIEGTVNLHDDIYSKSPHLEILNDTHVIGPVDGIKLKRGSLSIWAQSTGSINKRYITLVRINNSNVLYIYFYKSGNLLISYNNSVFSPQLSGIDSDWHHYVLTWQDEEQIIYKDGEPLDYQFAESPSPTKIDSFAIGWLGNSDSENWEGLINKITTFGRPITPVEVRALYRIGKSRLFRNMKGT